MGLAMLGKTLWAHSHRAGGVAYCRTPQVFGFLGLPGTLAWC